MSRLDEIYHGWKNNLFPAEEEKEIINEASSERRKICEECEFISTKHFTIRPDVHCTQCGCTLAAKTKSLESECPLKKWVKWEK